MDVQSEPCDEIRVDDQLELMEVAMEALGALIRNRDLIGYRLSQAQGYLEAGDLEKIETEYSKAARREPDPALDKKVKWLTVLIPDQIDVEIVSTVFGCGLDEAKKALTAALSPG